MTTATVEPPKVDPDAIAAEIGESRLAKWLKLSIQPVIVALALGAYLVWRATADLDSIEARALSWSNLGNFTWEHIQLSFVATVIVLALAIPLGVVLTRPATRRLAPLVVGIANIGQAAPAVGLIVLAALIFDLGFWPAIGALTLYGLLPSLRNTIVGLDQVDSRLVEAGRGMGMSAAAVLFRVELPLAVPVIVAGARTALVLLVGTAALAGFIDGGGLGELITVGIKLSRGAVLVSGALLVALLALLIDWLGRIVEEIARPKGI
ncbi:MAG: ABC transporter permease subunit [Streptosporangiales bacterium]|nr:ABC transporter permease subunit [Streptosporangiales bacterium]